ncbi:MAG: CDP-alcohol phosphatidyltransferase family protein [Gemmataceae bacterium]
MNTTASMQGERRPIAARDWSLSRRCASLLVDLGISPNAISLAGMGCGVGAGVLLAWTVTLAGLEQRLAWAGAALLVLLRLLANMFDGMVAIEGGRVSVTGELFNEVPDRISDAATLIGLGMAASSSLLLGALAACFALLTAYVRAMGKSLGAAQDFRGPMAKPQRMAAVIAVALGMACLPAEPIVLAGLGLPALALIVISAGAALTTLRRLQTIASFLHQQRS